MSTLQTPTDELTVDELAARVGIPTRTIRFYTSKKLLPPPRLEGRTGLYGPAHVARLTVIRDLQQAGYTLAAIEQFFATLPLDADAATIELFGTLLTPWVIDEPVTLGRQELAVRLGRPVDDQMLAQLERVGALTLCDDGRVAVTSAQLEFGVRLLDLEAPLQALVEAGDVIRQHAAALARDLQQVFRNRIVAHLDDADEADRERLHAIAAGLRPLTIQAIVAAYQQALEQEVRAQAARR